MNFKKEYQKAFADISADEAFKQRLAKEMNQAKAPRSKWKPYVGMLATAAALALMVGAVYRTGVAYDTKEPMQSGEESQVVQQNTPVKEEIEIPSGVKADGDFAASLAQTFTPRNEWCSGAENDEERLDMFLDLISGEDLERLYCSDKQGFDESDVVSDGQVEALAEKLLKTVATESFEEKNVTYYKAVFKDGQVIVFQIWNGEYLRIAGVDTIYKIEK